MNQNQRKYQMTRGLAIALSVLVVAAIIITVIAVVSARREKPNVDTTTTAPKTTTTANKPVETTTGKQDEPVIAEKPTFLSPVTGGVMSAAWSADLPVFSPTMEDYRLHLGVDIVAEAGTAVYAAADGTVESVEFHPMMGQTVTLTHTGGYKTVYKNLQTAIPEAIVPGKTVVAGEKIGAVGDTALIEIAEDPHLHFEIYKDGVSEDPAAHIDLPVVDASVDYED